MADLAHSPAHILRQLLIQLGQAGDVSDAGTATWPITVGSEAPTPDDVITSYDQAWIEDGRSMIDGETFHHYGCQLRVRSLSRTTGFAKAVELHRALDQDVYDELVTIDGVQYLVHSVSGTSVLALGTEGGTSRRWLFTVNCNFVADRKN